MIDPLHGMIGVAKALAGIDAAPEALAAARRDACRVCPHSTRNGAGKLTSWSVCRLCHCAIVFKVKIKGEVCPADPPRWPAE